MSSAVRNPRACSWTILGSRGCFCRFRGLFREGPCSASPSNPDTRPVRPPENLAANPGRNLRKIQHRKAINEGIHVFQVFREGNFFVCAFSLFILMYPCHKGIGQYILQAHRTWVVHEDLFIGPAYVEVTFYMEPSVHPSHNVEGNPHVQYGPGLGSKPRGTRTSRKNKALNTLEMDE